MSSRAAKRYEQQLYRKYLETENDEMTEEEQNIATLEADLKRAKEAYDVAAEAANMRRIEQNGAANRLAQAKAKLVGIEEGTIVEYDDRTGKTKHAVVSHVQQPRWSFHDDFTVYAKLILRDGSVGRRELELGADDFSPKIRTRFGSVDKEEIPPRARIVNDSGEV